MAEAPGEENAVIVAILIGLIIFLSLVLVWIAFPPLLDWIRGKIPVSPKRIARRYATIDGWLITKRVQPHDSCCHMLITQLADDPLRYHKPSCTKSATNPACSCTTIPTSCVCQSDPNAIAPRGYTFSSTCMLKKLSSIYWEKQNEELEGNKQEEDPEHSLAEEDGIEEDHSESTDGDDGDIMNKQCTICLEKFKVGEVVSWSCDERCQHVFHHECLREWLLRRIRCPCCRTIVLPVDRPKEEVQSTKGRRQLFGRERFTSEAMGNMASQRAKYLTRTYFCIENGLVVLRSIEPRKKAAEPAASTTASSSASDHKDEGNQSKSKRNFLFWKRERQEKNADSSQQKNEALNTTGSMCSNDSFGDVESDDEKAAPCQLHRRSTCRTVRMGSGSSTSEAYDNSAFDDSSDVEAADSSFHSETEQGFSSSSRTNSDEEYDQSYRSESGFSCSCRTNEGEDGHCLNNSCRTNDSDDDSSSTKSESSIHHELSIVQSETNTDNGMGIVRLENV